LHLKMIAVAAFAVWAGGLVGLHLRAAHHHPSGAGAQAGGGDAPGAATCVAPAAGPATDPRRFAFDDPPFGAGRAR
jgi:hypothetical protein